MHLFFFTKYLKLSLVFVALLLLLVSSGSASAQSKFGDNRTAIQPGSLMELESVNKGFLNVRMSTVQMLSIPVSAASNGMMVYNVDSACLCIYNGARWKSLCGAGSKTNQKKVIYKAVAGDLIFNAPEVIDDENNVQVFRNGVQINFAATLGTRILTIEADAICKKDDEIKIIQLLNK